MFLASKVGARLLTTTTGGGAQRYYRAFQCSHHLRPAKMTTTHQQIRGCALAAVRSSTRTTTAYDSHSSWKKKKNNDQLPHRPTKRECRTEIRTASSSSSSSAVAAAARVKEVAILGSGAAGLTAAYFAAVTQKDAKTVLRVTVYEKTKESGKKILMSGGARCNVLPVEATIDDYVTDSNPRLAKAILQSWTVPKCLSWLRDDVRLELGIEHTTNKYFPLSNSSREVRDKLVEACKREGVTFQYETNVKKITKNEANDTYVVNTEDGKDIEADVLVLSMGGSSFPAVGTDGTGYVIAERDLKVGVNKPYPALVPLVGEHPGGEYLPGVSLDCQVKIKKVEKKKAKQAARMGFLFTHKGYSGPSILDLSHNVVKSIADGSSKNNSSSNSNSSSVSSSSSSKLVVNWNPSCDWNEVLSPGKSGSDLVVRRLKPLLPTRLCEALLKEAGVDLTTNVSNLPKKKRVHLIDILSNYEIKATGHQGYRKAEVTGGGIALEGIDTKTMELKEMKNIYVCGEICDIFGRIGGFNFFWAWTSGRLAGISCSSGCKE